ncbi:MAG: hypothetical protein COA52_00515 [Hyphomicrobiales bacterium]|nr:MAG: hypothetical protein COA52_00515 [Hyphomicrobiales bacterium]
MIDYRKKTIAAVLLEVNSIKKKAEKIEALRILCMQNNAVAKVIQWTYHPDIVFDLPEGDVPESLWNATNHGEQGPFYRLINKNEIKNLTTNSIVPSKKKETIFISMLENVAADDAKLMIGIKNKILPYKTLNKKFCMEALPELLPEKNDEK